MDTSVLRRARATPLRWLLPCVLGVLVAWSGRPRRAEPVVVTLRPDRQFQTIRSFGASDAWSIQFVGHTWPAAQRTRAADLLFSAEERPDGSSVGIGLSACRFEIGAGSAAPGDSSRITDRWRRATGFLRRDGTYDWTQQPGQRAFMKEAKARGVDTFIGFVNSPPVALTRNGRANSSGGDSANLAPSRYGDYARFLRDVVVELEARDGIRLGILSPFNEPEWDWTSGQEGSPWRVDEMAAMTRVLSATLTDARLPTRITIGRVRPDELRVRAGRQADPRRAAAGVVRQGVSALRRRAAEPRARDRLAQLPHDVPAGHPARGARPGSTMRSSPWTRRSSTGRRNTASSRRRRGSGAGDATWGSTAALHIAGVIHADLVIAHASTWHWWIAASPYDYKDGLIYLDRDTLTGTVRDSKMLWALGHYSRFVRPGMRRIGVDVAGPAIDSLDAELLVSAYRDPASRRIVTVLVNRATEAREVELRAPGTTSTRVYRTTSEPGANLGFVGSVRASQPLLLPPRSLTTLVSNE